MNEKRSKLLAYVAVLAVLVAGIAVVSAVSTNASAFATTSFISDDGEVNFDASNSTSYGILSNAELKNSIGVSYDKASGTYYFTGYVFPQDLSAETGTFYNLWPDNTEKAYGIVFSVTKATNTAVYFGDNSGSAMNTNGDYEPCLLYLSPEGSKTFDMHVGDLEYTVDVSGLRFITESDAAGMEVIGPESFTSQNNYTVTLESDAVFIGSISDAGTYTLNLNGHNIVTGDTIVRGTSSGTAVDINMTIDANGGSITSTNTIVFAYSSGDLVVNGGTYSTPSNGFVWYAPSNSQSYSTLTTTATFTDADITALNAIWTSNGGIANVTIDGCTIDASNIGIYLGTLGDDEAKEDTPAQGAIVKNSTIDAASTAIEIKSGVVTIDNCTIHSDGYEASDGVIGNGSSGSGVDTICINNGYTNSGMAEGVMVTITNSTIINSKTNSPVQVVVGSMANDDGTVATGNITLTSNCLDSTQIEMGYTAAALNEGRTITLDLGGQNTVTASDANAIASAGEDVDVIVFTGSSVTMTEQQATDKTVVFNEAITSGQIYLTGNGQAVFSKSVTATINTIDANGDTSTATLSGISGNFTISVGSIVMGGVTYTEDAGSVTITGDAYVDGSFTVGAGVTLTIDADATLEVPAGATLTVNGTVTNNGRITNTGIIYNNGTFGGDGIVNNNNGAIYNADGKTVTCTVNGNQPIRGFGISSNMDAIESDLLLSGYAFLTSNLTIPEGKSITVGSNAILDLQGYTITVEGQLIVQIGGQIIAYNGGEDQNANIIDIDGGSITNEGTIGAGSVPVTVSADNGSVELMNVDGVSFGIYTVDRVEYLSISGMIVGAISNYDSYVFNINGAYIVGELTITDDITTVIGVNGVTVTNGAVLNIDGTVSGDAITMLNGSTVQIDGTCGAEITANTGKYITRSGSATETTTVTLDNVTGVTLTVTSTSSVEQVAGNSVRYTTQVLNIYGAVKVIDDTDGGNSQTSLGTVTVENSADTTTGISYVPEGQTLNLSDDVSAELGGMIVLGTVQYTDGPVTGYVGTQYSIKSENNDTINYIQPFTVALGQIGTAYQNTIYVHGPVEVKAGFTLTNGQTVNIVEGEFTIAAEAAVTVEAGARIAGAVDEVVGVLTLERGAPNTTVNKYAVFSQGTDGSRTYSGFAAAISNSAAGDTINVVGYGYNGSAVEVEGNVTIPADRTVVVQCTMSFDSNLVIEEGAVLNNQNLITMTGERSTITVNGTMDNSESTVTGDTVVFSQTANNTYRGIYAYGQFIVDDLGELALGGTNTSNVHAFVNGAYYFDNEDNIVVTTFANAVAAMAENNVKAIYIIGTINESGDLTVGNGEDEYSVRIGYYENGVMNLPGNVVLGNITLDNATLTMETGYNNNNHSSITATVSGAYGIEGSTSVASIVLDGVGGIVITNVDGVNDLAETYWYNTITGFTGDLTVSAGEVDVSGSTYSVASGSSLTVASGATLVVPTGVTLNLDDNIDIVGTVSVEGTLGVSTAATVDGTVDIAENGVLNFTGELTINGALNIDAEGTATIAGTLNVGETPKTLAAVGTSASVSGTMTVTGQNKVIAYAGADLSQATIMASATSEARHTTYTINGIEYATVYGSVKIVAINQEIAGLKDLNVPNIGTNETSRDYDNDIVWYAGETSVSVSDNIGAYDSVSTEIEYQTVGIVISIGTHITVSIDNVIVNTTNGQPSYPIGIGTHTISAVVDPGYSGEVTILFNGETVTNGQLVITSDMLGTDPVLSVSGQLTQDMPTITVPGTSSGDDGMGLTDYLLIILVILIVIMAIMVAFRLMRS